MMMPSCRKCGAYTKYNDGLCFSCYKKNNSKAGKVYFAETTRKDGSKKIYVGQTKRSVYKRVGEHITEVKKPQSKTYTGRGTNIRILGSIFSHNRFKAEKSCKRLTPTQKRALAKKGASKVKKSGWW